MKYFNKLLLLFASIATVFFVGKLAFEALPADSWMASVFSPIFDSGNQHTETGHIATGPSGTGQISANTEQNNNARLNGDPAPSQSQHNHDHTAIDDQKLAELIDKHISPSMRREINEKLRPGGMPPKRVIQGNLDMLDTSDRAATVVVGMIDENNNLIVTDFTSPLPEQTASQ